MQDMMGDVPMHFGLFGGGRVKRCVNRSGGQLLPGVDCGHSLVVLCINNV